jgi:hypothetical protein
VRQQGERAVRRRSAQQASAQSGGQPTSLGCRRQGRAEEEGGAVVCCRRGNWLLDPASHALSAEDLRLAGWPVSHFDAGWLALDRQPNSNDASYLVGSRTASCDRAENMPPTACRVRTMLLTRTPVSS